MKILTIERDKWMRGGKDDTALLNDNGMCCLGFLGKACGLSDADIQDASTPEGSQNPGAFPNFIINEDETETETCATLIEINDDSELSDEDREINLRRAFRDNGWKVRFI